MSLVVNILELGVNFITKMLCFFQNQTLVLCVCDFYMSHKYVHGDSYIYIQGHAQTI